MPPTIFTHTEYTDGVYTSLLTTLQARDISGVEQILPARKGRITLIFGWQQNNNNNNNAFFFGGPPGVGLELSVANGVNAPPPGPFRLFTDTDDSGIIDGPIWYRKDQNNGMFTTIVEVWCNCPDDEKQ